jgi:hypothetical protein
MMETRPDHGQTWKQFYDHRRRRVDEIGVVYKSLTWWEQQEADRELSRLWFEINLAEGHIEVDTED